VILPDNASIEPANRLNLPMMFLSNFPMADDVLNPLWPLLRDGRSYGQVVVLYRNADCSECPSSRSIRASVAHIRGTRDQSAEPNRFQTRRKSSARVVLAPVCWRGEDTIVCYGESGMSAQYRHWCPVLVRRIVLDTAWFRQSPSTRRRSTSAGLRFKKNTFSILKALGVYWLHSERRRNKNICSAA